MQSDVLIVGAGSSGSALAARVSEDPNREVLLIEAGPDYSELAQLPFDLVNSHNNSYRDHDWGLRYAPTPGADQPLPRGRVVGGSSAVNTTIALRGVPEDYDEWAHQGCDGWSWQEVLLAFCRLERDLDFGAEPYHGDAGPISIRRYPPSELLPAHSAFLDAAQRLDYPYCADANAPDEWGAGPHPMNKLGRLRVSTAIGYLAAARARPNLTIAPDTLVRRLLIESGRCVGVEVQAADGTITEQRAALVVLCAGALLSPTVLMRSGIGPAEQLLAQGIDVRQDVAAVGANLADHPALSVVCDVRDPALVDFDAPIIQTILRYTAPGSDKRNDLQIEQLSFAGRPDGPARFAIAAVLEYQYGRGRVTLASADPKVGPGIDNNFCVDPRDAERLALCFKDTLSFAEQPPLADLIAGIRFPRNAQDLSLGEIEDLCRRYAASGYHPCGTLKMGPRHTKAVVAASGCCHYLDGLVVADASIMPSVPRANTNLTCIMIGEQIGEWIRTKPAHYGL